MWYFCHDQAPQLHLGNSDEGSIVWLLRHLVSLRRHADLRADSSMHHSSSEQLPRLLRHSLDSLDSLDSKVPNRLGEIWDPCQGIWKLHLQGIYFFSRLWWAGLSWAGFDQLGSWRWNLARSMCRSHDCANPKFKCVGFDLRTLFYFFPRFR